MSRGSARGSGSAHVDVGQQVDAVELITVRVPMKSSFRAAHGTIVARDVVLVRIIGTGSEGWGECAALPEPTYTGEYTAGALAVLRDHLVPRWMAGGDLRSVRGHPMATAALRMAALDARLRIESRSLADYVGAVHDSVPAGVALGRTATVADLVDEVGLYRSMGYRRIKIKIEPGWDVAPLQAVIGEHGQVGNDDAVSFVADANGSYSLDDETHTRALVAIDELGLAFLEQPLAPDRLLHHARLAQRLRTPIALDESITSAAVAADAFALDACRGVSVKPGRVGGIDEALALIGVCAREGRDVWIGGMFETGLGRAAAVALSATAGVTQTGDLSASNRYFDHDLTEPFTLRDGLLQVPSGPGVGVTVDLDAHADWVTSRETIRRP